MTSEGHPGGGYADVAPAATGYPAGGYAGTSYGETRYGEAPGPRRRNHLSIDGLLAAICAALLVVCVALDGYVLSKHKHRICDSWLAKGQKDCAGGDGFHEWSLALAKQGVLLLLVELIVVPVAVYGVARLVRGAAAER